VTGRRGLLAVVLAALAMATPPTAATPGAENDVLATRDAQAEAARSYRERLTALLPLHEAAEARAAADARQRRALLAEGLVARADVEAADRRLAESRQATARTRVAMREADALVTDAEAAREVVTLPPPPPGALQERSSMIRFAGGGRWSLAALPTLERFFTRRFGQPLPISALGQTAMHDRLGFDHRHAVDVALHPDSAEGRALMAYLRTHDISFLAFRAARPGAATGAHVHVGDPSGTIGHGGPDMAPKPPNARRAPAQP
jgi:hypothetical protein